jgi:hypothetical protein
LQLAAAVDLSLLVGGREAGRKCIPAERRFARTKKHDIVRHRAKQDDEISRVDGIDPGQVQFANGSFIRFHVQAPPNG